jgi:hypothetical protein
MTGWPYGYVMTNSTNGIMGVLTLLAVIALVVIDHALEDTLVRHFLVRNASQR